DDAADILLLEHMVLSGAGYTVTSAATGEEAVEMLRVTPAPDLVVLDLQMPTVDGWQVLASIRASEHTAAIPVVLCTVKSSRIDMERGWEMGADGYLVKPFGVDELKREVHDVL